MLRLDSHNPPFFFLFMNWLRAGVSQRHSSGGVWFQALRAGILLVIQKPGPTLCWLPHLVVFCQWEGRLFRKPIVRWAHETWSLTLALQRLHLGSSGTIFLEEMLWEFWLCLLEMLSILSSDLSKDYQMILQIYFLCCVYLKCFFY